MSIPTHFNGSLLNIMAGASGGGPPVTCPNPTTIFTQAFDNTGTAFASQFDSSGGGLGDYAKAYDDFTFTHGALVTDIHWTGGYSLPLSEVVASGFNIEFWNDNAGQPGTLHQTATFTPAQGAPVSQGTIGSTAVFTYAVTLTANFIALPGVKYWISIQAIVAGSTPQWVWCTAGAGSAWQVFFGDGEPLTNNLAYDLTGCLGS